MSQKRFKSYSRTTTNDQKMTLTSAPTSCPIGSTKGASGVYICSTHALQLMPCRNNVRVSVITLASPLNLSPQATCIVFHPNKSQIDKFWSSGQLPPICYEGRRDQIQKVQQEALIVAKRLKIGFNPSGSWKLQTCANGLNIRSQSVYNDAHH
ncbi:hypothetical protein RRG08_032195 [Elysia crispata]|uniref:Uncharacterized protein n=1 Tax=Elysia crispata TaxID=231223 RepID=A0AAE1DVY9_9GAST|nr:hypothetical protein RRG08_032195 [Elysia crispata]